MAKQSISQTFKHAEAHGDLDFLNVADTTSNFEAPKLNDITNTLIYLGALYADRMAESLRKANSISSGRLADSIIPLDVKLFGSVYVVEISALKYAQFIDQGVDGWGGPSKGGAFKFKTKGVDPNGDMVKSVKEWLVRENKISRIPHKVTVNLREAKRQTITDTSTKAAMSAAFMIKRMGIKPTHFIKSATDEMRQICFIEFGKALKVDFINAITS